MTSLGRIASSALGLGERLWHTGVATAVRATGRPAGGPMPVDSRDRRFADPAWEGNAAFWGLRQAYLAWRQFGTDVLDGDGGPAWPLLADAMAPTNFPVTNPAVLRRAFDTGGLSLVAGGRRFADDLRHNGGRPRQVDSGAFEVGRTLAATPSTVVFRNELIELLQYAPQTGLVHAVPLLCSPPWINKYYVMDLSPGRSLIEWAVRHGRTVFAISYRNPDASMAALTMDDYLADGLRAALDAITGLTGSERVDLLGLCLGGTLAAMTAAADERVGSVTLLNTLVDFAEPGILGSFTGPAMTALVGRRMRRRGYLDAADLARTFDLLRPGDLIFPYVVSGWLMGEAPPAFDVLAWNADATRMPAAMHSSFLREFYGRRARVDGLDRIDQDLYVVSAVNDHIVPWTSAYATLRHVRGDARFVLSSGGHIAGIVNPPSDKAWYETGGPYPADPLRWRPDAERRPGSWWEDWARWGSQRAGDLVEPPPTGPGLGAGPGDYVRS